MELTPAQQRVLDLLRRPSEPVRFRPGLADDLRGELEEELGPAVAGLPQPLWVNKHGLASVHACEAHHLAQEAAGFEWSVATARGTVAHKAIELSVFWRGEPQPMTLVEEALERLADTDVGAGRFLQGLGEGDRAQLLAEANDRVATFLECFPPLQRAWRPVTESRATVELLDGAVVLAGKVDLTLGAATGEEARKVIIDLKSGMPVPTHRDDLRFYALVETLKLGVPPRLVATFYLDAARAQPEEVTEPLLWAALARAADGTRKMIELASGRPPAVRPGPPCRWCPIRSTCESGLAHLAEPARYESDDCGPGDPTGDES